VNEFGRFNDETSETVLALGGRATLPLYVASDVLCTVGMEGICQHVRNDYPTDYGEHANMITVYNLSVI
jgi:hypothetical protein